MKFVRLMIRRHEVDAKANKALKLHRRLVISVVPGLSRIYI